MKSATLFAAILLLVSSTLFSCTEQQDMVTGPEDMLSRGNWTVDYYFNGQDQTAQYGSYSFTFNSNGIVSCANTVHNCTGTWQIRKNVQSDELSISLTTQQPELQQLNQNWSIAEASMQSLTLTNGTGQFRLRKQ